MNKTNKVFIIAEAGVNHNGSIELAKKLIDVAVDAKVDAVKFQTFIAENVVSKKAEKAEYQKAVTGQAESQLEMIKKLQLSFDDFKELQDYCNSRNILFLSTPFDMESIDFLATLNMGLWKIPSGEITNFPYLQKIGSYNSKVIFSTGMATLGDIEQTISILTTAGTDRENISILHCNTEYPTPMKDVNLKAMLTIQSAFGLPTGYSDHTLGIEIPVAAVALGATIIEKHFTLDKNFDGPDHKASLDPQELKDMVTAIRNIEESIAGNGIKQPSESEIKNMHIARKSVVAKTDIAKGEIFTTGNITTKRPGNGISAIHWDIVLGQTAKKDFSADDLIEL